jgi:hypothetical protein
VSRRDDDLRLSTKPDGARFFGKEKTAFAAPMKCGMSERTADFVVGDSLGAVLR